MSSYLWPAAGLRWLVMVFENLAGPAWSARTLNFHESQDDLSMCLIHEWKKVDFFLIFLEAKKSHSPSNANAEKSKLT